MFNPRISKIEYLLRLAEVAAQRSEDPFYQVGAVAVDEDWRVVATGYNGLLPGQSLGGEFWEDKERRKPFVIHAEQNLCAQFKRGEVKRVAVTLQPCENCLKQMVAQGVEHIYYREEHPSHSTELAIFYDVEFTHVPHGSKPTER